MRNAESSLQQRYGDGARAVRHRARLLLPALGFAARLGRMAEGQEVTTCVDPTTMPECAAAATVAGHALGGNGWIFEGPYSCNCGCYTYTEGEYSGIAYWSTGGNDPVPVDGNLVRVCMPPCGVGQSATNIPPFCEPCPAGSVTDTLTQPGGTTCSACAAGRYDDDSDSTTACADCAPGSVTNTRADTGATSCAACAAGQYSPQSTTACADCSPGSITGIGDASSATSCTGCVAGRYSATSIDDACTECVAGEFAAAQATSCTPCDAGSTTDTLSNGGGASCTACTAGQYSASSQLECVACQRGRYSANVGATACDACSAGQFGQLRGAPSAEDGCQACGLGQHSESAAIVCVACVAGQVDGDSNPSTPCTSCQPGSYSGCGTTACSECAAGFADLDTNPGTPCTSCQDGSSWAATGANSIATCEPCAAGWVDHDRDSLTSCTICPAGTQSGLTGVECTLCTELGLIDEDMDPSTSCTAPDGSLVCTQECPVGYEDLDCRAATPCTACTAGMFSEGGVNEIDASGSQCKACAPGMFAPQGSLQSDCAVCPSGYADEDANAWTECTACGAGKFTALSVNLTFVDTGASHCTLCPPGRVDSDSDSSTDCVDCPAGRANQHIGSTAEADCTQCSAGKWAAGGLRECTECVVGTHRPAALLAPCAACNGLGATCDLPGLATPRALPGFFAHASNASGLTINATITRCIPFYSCLGTCDENFRAQLLEVDAPDIQEDSLAGAVVSQTANGEINKFVSEARCPGGIGTESCSPGYTGSRCSVCVAFDADIVECTVDRPNGFYRSNQRVSWQTQQLLVVLSATLSNAAFAGQCEPCACSFVTFNMMVIAAILAVFAFLWILDWKVEHASDSDPLSEHASILLAPFFILVTFGQVRKPPFSAKF